MVALVYTAVRDRQAPAVSGSDLPAKECAQLRGDVISRGGRHGYGRAREEGRGNNLADPEMLIYSREHWGDM